MSRYKKDPRPSPETREEAMKIARANQRPGQTKEQTKLIAQGIQKGIDQYKRQQKAKARELNKHRNRLSREKSGDDKNERNTPGRVRYRHHWLPWLLLALTWISIAIYALGRSG